MSRSAALLVLLLTAACAPRASDVFGSGPNGERGITLEVSNNNFSDATIWTYRYSARTRAGVVGGKGRRELRVEWNSPAPLSVEIRLLSGETCRTREIQADPGDVIQIDVPIDVRTDPDCQSLATG